jgi:outer membrane protein assembly complex protein YaeT
VSRICRLIPVALLAALVTAACHEVGDVKVLSLSFEGTSAFRAGQLRRLLATQQSGWLPWSEKHYFDREEFEADLQRIVAFYNDRGFPEARISDVRVEFNQKKDGVRLTIAVEEGAPVLVQEVRYEGFGVLPDDVEAGLPGLPLKAGERRDRDTVRVTRERATSLFRERGYPFAIVDAGERPGQGDRSVIIIYRADPGELVTFGDVRISGLERLEEKDIRRELAFEPGEVFDQRLIAQTQRRIGALEVLDVAVVTPRLEDVTGGVVPVAITIVEGKPRRLRLGAGYGSEELARGTIRWEHLNFTGGAKQATLDGKWSAIDRGFDVSLVDPHAWRSGLSSRFALSAWRTQQLTYESETYGGNASLAYQTDPTGTGRETARFRLRATYAISQLRYGIRPEFLNDQSQRDERIALGLDPDTGRARGRLATVQFDVERYALDNASDPHRGTLASAHAEFAAPGLGGTYKYAEIGGEVRGFVPVGRIVLAGRLRASAITTSDPTLVPFSKRYFLGGSSSIRGWSRFEISPLDAEGRPIGGFSMLDFSGEVRVPLPRPRSLGLVGFVDGGNVWSEGWSIQGSDLVWAAGVGVRYLTPIGALRVDFATQLTPIERLVINGEPSTRRWRIHFNIGHSF